MSLSQIYLAARDRGASMVEYALLIVLIAVVAIVAVNLVGPQVSGAYSSAGSGLAAN
jgi:Flp pilus assembly pilin Flp